MAKLSIPIQVNGLETLRDVMDKTVVPTDPDRSDDYNAGYRDCWRRVRYVVGELTEIEEGKTE